ncbi:MAG: protein kinase [archaeon]|nr:protein kinase [archaeon]
MKSIIPPKKSKYTKTEANYHSDCLFDLIDVKDNLSTNHFIKKVPLDLFLYANDLKEKNVCLVEKSTVFKFNLNEKGETKEDPVDYKDHNINFEEFNNNRFGIDFNELYLEYPNDYKIKFTEVYFPIKILGQGAFGLVISCVDLQNSNELIAVKIIDKRKFSKSEESRLFQEVNILKGLNNPRILKIFDLLNTTDYFFIFMELIKGGTLKELILKRYKDNSKDYLFTDEECSNIVKGILQATNYLHQNNIVHRDLKPENILLKDEKDLNSIILCDFGMACEFSNYEFTMQEKCGTLIFMAPEVVDKKSYDHLADSFSTGIILYLLASGGSHPIYRKGMSGDEYQKIILNYKKRQMRINKGLNILKFSTEGSMDEDEMKRKIGDNVNPFIISESMPLLARNLFLKLCKFETFNRYEIFRALNHPWITRNPESPIPLTVNEGFERTEKIQKFKTLISAMIYVKIYRDTKLQKKAPPQPEFISDTPSRKKKIVLAEVSFRKKAQSNLSISKSPITTPIRKLGLLKDSPTSAKDSPTLKKFYSPSNKKIFLLKRPNQLNEISEEVKEVREKRKQYLNSLTISTQDLEKKNINQAPLTTNPIRKSTNSLSMLREMKGYKSFKKNTITTDIDVTAFDNIRQTKSSGQNAIKDNNITLKANENKYPKFKLSHTPNTSKIGRTNTKNPISLNKDSKPVKITQLVIKKGISKIPLPYVQCNTTKNTKNIVNDKTKINKTKME